MAQVAGFAGTRLDISDFPTRHPYGLGLWQKHIERILAGWVAELKVPVHYGTEVTGFAQDDTGVDVALSDGQRLRAQYLVGCDGGRSLVRKASRHRVPRLGSDDERPARRGRDDRGAGIGHSPHSLGHACPGQGRVRDQGRRGAWPPGWEGWRPPSGWEPLSLPHDWDAA